MVEKQKKDTVNRLKRIEGQIRGIEKMIENDAYCIDIITQTSAIRSAIKSLEDELLKKHLRSCAALQVKNGNEDKMVGEILKVYKLKK